MTCGKEIEPLISKCIECKGETELLRQVYKSETYKKLSKSNGEVESGNLNSEPSQNINTRIGFIFKMS